MDLWNRVIEICGLLLIAAGFFVFLYRCWFLVDAVHTTGQVDDVVEYESGPDGDGGQELFGTRYAPVISFRDQQGLLFRFHGNVATSWWHRSINEPVKVAYDPSNPERAIISGGVELWSLPVLLAVMGLWIVRDRWGSILEAVLH